MKPFVRLFLFLFLFIHYSDGQAANKYRSVTVQQIRAEGKIWGIDLSHHQAKVDWVLLKKDKPHFVYLKATEGSTHIDRLYHENYTAARKAGLTVGSYHFFSYLSDGRTQAAHFLQFARYKAGDMPLVLDAEFRGIMPSADKVRAELIAFLKAVTTKTGRKPIIYCDYDYYLKYLKGHLKNEHQLWICDYREQPDAKWLIWQATDQLRIKGVKGKVDFNIFNGTKKQLTRLLK
jgi:lysozyme